MEPITIEKNGLAFTVQQGDRYADEVTFEEMLGLVVKLTLPDNFVFYYENWMRTKEQWDEWRAYLGRMSGRNNPKETLLLEMKL